MTDTQACPAGDAAERGRWTLGGAEPNALLARLTQMDRVMLAIRQDGLLHERLGRIREVRLDGGHVVLGGTDPVARIPQGLLAAVRLDVSAEMRGKLYPRLEFLDRDGTHVFSVTGLEGAAPFLSPLATLNRTPLPPPSAEDPVDTPEDPTDQDPALQLLGRLQRAAQPLRITARQYGIRQSWQGVIDRLMPMGGHVNIITKPFHLHLRAGLIAAWDSTKGHHVALDAQARPLGLEITET
ncbi:hypothetical protein KUV61_04755 [Nocardioides marinus]|nr:hypothetical protein [Nocardioides marinus]